MNNQKITFQGTKRNVEEQLELDGIKYFILNNGLLNVMIVRKLIGRRYIEVSAAEFEAVLDHSEKYGQSMYLVAIDEY